MKFLTLNNYEDDEDLKKINDEIERKRTSGTNIVIIGSSSIIDQCSYCNKIYNNKKQKLQVCGKCRQVKYCGKECQKSDWKKHKLECGQKNNVSTYMNQDVERKLSFNTGNKVSVEFK